MGRSLMLSVHGYKIGERIHQTPQSEVYAATRASDGLKVVLKIYAESHSDLQHSRAQREFDLLCRIQAPGVVRAVEVVPCEDRQALVVERFLGFPLGRYVEQQGRLGPAELLSIATQISRSLAGVHDARIVHKDLKLSNILVNTDLQTCLIDFGIAAELGRAEPATRTESVEGTLNYIAPEQTGRMGLGVDFRTDLYSLGATLYELLTGRPLFEGLDAVQLIHAHMAQRPVAPVEMDPKIPLALSRIVEKLLEKDPERRYQTARGLHADLKECLDQLRSRGEIAEDFVLGTQDASDRLRFRQQLCGREQERAQLLAAFERAARKSAQLVVLAGPGGIGKSSLPAVLRDRLSETGGYLATGKFDRDGRDRAYAGFTAALTSLVDQILAERRDRVDDWAAAIEKGVGAIGAELLKLAPNLQFVIEDLPPVPALGPAETRERLALAATRLVRVFAQPSHPLVLFLDDLQWADAGSLFLFETLLRSTEPQALLLIGSYRDNEVDAQHPLTALLERLRGAGAAMQVLTVSPLSFDDINAIVAGALARDPRETEWLSRRIGLKTQNNPLLVRRLLLHLWERDLLRYEHGAGWVWDEQQLTEAEITDDAAAMLAHRIHALRPDARELLKLASLVGDVFDVEGLAELSGTDRLDLLQQLMALTEEGFVAPCRQGFKFVHDRLREAAQSLLPERERTQLHHRMARLLLAATPRERWPERAIEIADHLNRAVGELSEPERQYGVTINLAAGRRSLAAGSAAIAARYFEFGRSLFCEQDWERRFEESFELFLDSAEAAYQLRLFGQAEQLLSRCDSVRLSFSQQIALTAKRISVLTFLRSDAALDLGLATLRRLGLRWPKRPSWLRVRLAILRTDWFLRGHLQKQRVGEDRQEDEQHIHQLTIIRAAGGVMHYSSLGLMCLVTSYSLRSQVRRGVSNPVFSLTGYALYRMRFLRNQRHAQRYAHAAEAWMKNRPMLRSEFHLWSVLHAWHQPRTRTSAELGKFAERAREVGDIEYCGYALTESCAYLMSSGESLDVVTHYLEVAREVPSGPSLQESYRRMYGLLAQDGLQAIDWSWELSAEANQATGIGSPLVKLHWTTVLCMFGEYKLAADQADGVADYVHSQCSPVAYLADYCMFRGLAQAVLAGEARRAERRPHRALLRSCLRQLATWSRHAPDVFHMHQFLSAERARLRGRHAQALHMYREVTKRARERGFRQHAALAYERSADLLCQMRRETEGELARKQAVALYREWGAHAKVHQLEAKQPSSGRNWSGLDRTRA